jgi:hypothetical protein
MIIRITRGGRRRMKGLVWSCCEARRSTHRSKNTNKDLEGTRTEKMPRVSAKDLGEVISQESFFLVCELLRKRSLSHLKGDRERGRGETDKETITLSILQHTMR